MDQKSMAFKMDIQGPSIAPPEKQSFEVSEGS